MDISIVIPAYNEENRIEATLKSTIRFLEKNFKRFEIIVVDDGSSDMTVEIVSKYDKDNVKILKNSHNIGKGFSVKKGVLSAIYELILFMDSDLSIPIEELDNFVKTIANGYDVVIGSRNVKESKILIKQPGYRKLIGLIFSKIVIFLLGFDITDTQCGFKLFTKEAAAKIFPNVTVNRFALDPEVLFIAKKFGLKVKEVPVTWRDNKNSKVRVIKDSSIMLKDIFKIRYNNLIGLYNK